LGSSEATKEFWSGLIEEVANHVFGDADGLMQKRVQTATRQPLEEDQLPTDPPPPYELHDPVMGKRTQRTRGRHQ
jgi:hypothetical protein